MPEFKPSPLNRRRFVAGASKSAIAIGLAPLFQALQGCSDSANTFNPNAGAASYGPLSATADSATGMELLRLPAGFSYTSLGWTGDIMSDGTLTPDRHDGMAVVSGQGGSSDVVLIRNHERGVAEADNPLPIVGADLAPVYDGFRFPGLVGGLAGGTTALTLRGGQLVDDRATLGGTLTNCAGGPTPWGSWLTCEETMVIGSLIGAEDHGFVFEVPDPALAMASAVPIKEMGLMRHEAVAVDPRDSRVYLTEDNGPLSGFYRFTPNDTSQQVGSLENGGVLEMLAVRGQPGADLGAAAQGDAFTVEWVPIPDPVAQPETLVSPGDGFPPVEGQGRSGPFLQGQAAGGASFRRGEGCWYQDGVIYFVDTAGGEALRGSVWAYVPGEETLNALFVSPGETTADNPDNITVTPQGRLLVCEDGGGISENDTLVTGARLLGIGQDGSSFVFAENNIVIDSPLPNRPFIEPADYRGREWCGACFDPTGTYLYVNIQTPGITFAITGPWGQGPF